MKRRSAATMLIMSRRRCFASISLLLSLSSLAIKCEGQQANTTTAVDGSPDVSDYFNYSTIDPLPNDSDGIDYEGCYQDLVSADTNKDGAIKSNEYLAFVQAYGKRLCHYTDRLTLQQRGVFNALACRCQAREGYAADCCLGGNAQIETAGALDAVSRTQEELTYLTAVCRVTDSTISDPRGCPDDEVGPNEPPPFEHVPAAPGDDGFTTGQLIAILVGTILGALLFLLFCCCCCVVRRRNRRTQDGEDYDSVQRSVKSFVEDVEQCFTFTDLEKNAPRRASKDRQISAVTEIPADGDESQVGELDDPNIDVEASEEFRSARGTASIYLEEDPEEEVRKARGTAKILADIHNKSRRLRGSGAIPEAPTKPRQHKLHPIEKEEEGNLQWDYPGQAVEYPREGDNMAAAKVGRYVPDGGVAQDRRVTRTPSNLTRQWKRPETDDPDEVDDRKHRIQSGLGEGAVWDKLEQHDDSASVVSNKSRGDDWVVQSAIGVLYGHDDATAGAVKSALFQQLERDDKVDIGARYNSASESGAHHTISGELLL